MLWGILFWNAAPTDSGTRRIPRKWLLFGAACGRKVWHLLTDPASRAAVVAAEVFADGLLQEAELHAALEAARAAWQPLYAPVQYDRDCTPELFAALTAARLWPDSPADREPQGYSGHVASSAIWALVEASGGEPGSDDRWRAQVRANRALADLFRCVMGNPYQAVAFRPEWFSPTAVALAEAIYAERAFDRLPILADALEDAGCDSPDILAHCRQPGEHVRGCWVVDLVRGIEDPLRIVAG